MENKTPLRSFPCKLHPSEPVQRVLKSKDTDNCLRCVECILDNIDNAPKSAFMSLNDFIEEATKHYASNSGSQTLEGPVPNELVEFLSSEESNIQKLKQHVDQEKTKVIEVFDSLQQRFTQLCQSQKEELCKQLDLQVDTLKLNYKYYGSTIHKYFNQDSQRGDLDKESLINKINECESTNELEVVVKNIKDDIEASSASVNRYEAKVLLKESLGNLAEELKAISETRPKTSFLQENYHEEYLKKFDDLINPFIESCSQITSKVEELALKKGFAANSKILKQPDLELLKTWINPSHGALSSLKLLYRASRNGFNLKSFHQHCDNYENTLVIARTEDDRIYGGFSDQLWNDNTNLTRESEKSWIFNLSAKAKYSILEGCKVQIRTTFGAGFYFGGVSDFALIFADDIKASSSVDASMLQSQSYAIFNPTNYQDLTKTNNGNSLLQAFQALQMGTPPLQTQPNLSSLKVPLLHLPDTLLQSQQQLQSLQSQQLLLHQQQQQQKTQLIKDSLTAPLQQFRSFMQRSDSTVNQELVIRNQAAQLFALESNKSEGRSKVTLPNQPFALKEIEVFHLLPVAESTPKV